MLLFAALAAAAPPPVAVAVWPARTSLVAPASRTFAVRNVGAAAVAVEIGHTTRNWLNIRPSRFELRSGASRALTVRARTARGARPGDHELRVFLLARPLTARRIAVRMRIGVRLRVRMPGAIVRKLEIRGLRIRRRLPARVLLVAVRNAGNVTEQLRGRVTVTLFHGGRVTSRLRARGVREVFPGARAVIALPYAGGVRGRVQALVQARPGVRRRFWLRL